VYAIGRPKPYLYLIRESRDLRTNTDQVGPLVRRSGWSRFGCRGVMVAFEPSDETFGKVETPILSFHSFPYLSSILYFTYMQ
jgi:hypothetical protein